MGKKLLSVVLILALALSNVVVSYADTTTAKVTELSGTVKVKRSGSSKEFDAFDNMKLGVGDKITTGTDGTCTIVVDDDNVMKLSKSTSLTFKNLSKVGKEPSSAYTLHFGSVSNSVNKKGFAKDSYKVNTTNTVMGVRGTVFEVAKEIAENGDEAVSLVTLDGTVAVSNREQGENGYNSLNEVGEVTANQQIIFSNNDSDNGEIVVLDISKMDAESLQWLLDNKEYLTTEQVENVNTALVEAEKNEKAKQEKIQEKLKQYENEPVQNVVNPPTTSTPDIDENDNDGDDSTNGNGNGNGNGNAGGDGGTDGTGETGGDGGTDGTGETGGDGGTDGNGETGGDGGTDGTGETEEVKKDYEINNVDDFVELNNVLNTSGSAVVATVNINIDLNMASVNNWVPASLDGVTINGNNHTISNLQIKNTDANSNIGLFGEITNSTVQDLTLSAIITDSANAENAGALAGTISLNNTIQNIEVNNSIVSGNFAGSVAGQSYSPFTNIEVSNNTVQGTTIGGVVGGLYNSKIDNSNVINTTIQENGNVGIAAVGGVVGYAENAVIENCTYSGNKNIVGTYGVAGGIVGKALNTTISKVKIDTIGDLTAALKVGGVVGEANTCTIEAAEVKADNLVSLLNSGGVIGSAYGDNTVNNIYLEMDSVVSISTATSRIVSANNGGKLTINHTISIINGLYDLNLYTTNTGMITTSNSYYYVNSSDLVVNSHSKTLEQLQQSSLYTGWDTNVWNIVDGQVPSLK